MRVRVPEVLVCNRALRHDDGVLVPDAITAIGRRDVVQPAAVVPNDLVVPRLAAAAFDHAVPLVDGPGAVAVLGGAIGVAVLPRLVPLHDEVVSGVGRVTPDHAVEHPIRAVGRAVEDTRHIVVTVLVEGIGGLVAQDRGRRGGVVVAGAEGQHEKEREEEPDVFHYDSLKKNRRDPMSLREFTLIY